MPIPPLATHPVGRGGGVGVPAHERDCVLGGRSNIFVFVQEGRSWRMKSGADA